MLQGKIGTVTAGKTGARGWRHAGDCSSDDVAGADDDGGGVWPLQDIHSRRGCCARINHPFIPPRPPALPTLVQYYCTAIGQYTTPFPPSRLCYTPHNIGNNNIM